jgi:predicted amidophosphoribosyltransferase
LRATAFERNLGEQKIQGCAFVPFNSRIAKLLHNLKEKHIFVLADYIAELMVALPGQFSASGLAKVGIDRFNLITWSPSSAASTRKRGFVPAEMLAMALRWQLGLPSRLRPKSTLRLIRKVEDQAGLSASERVENLRFSMRAKALPPNSRVLVIDDVVTTGATAAEIQRALIDAGAQSVQFLVFAETFRKTQAKQ